MAAPGCDLDGVGRQQVDDDLQRRRIADLEQRLAGRHHPLALLGHAQHAAGDRRAQLDAARLARLAGGDHRLAGVAARRHQRRARRLEVVGRGAFGELRRLELLAA